MSDAWNTVPTSSAAPTIQIQRCFTVSLPSSDFSALVPPHTPRAPYLKLVGEAVRLCGGPALPACRRYGMPAGSMACLPKARPRPLLCGEPPLQDTSEPTQAICDNHPTKSDIARVMLASLFSAAAYWVSRWP